MATNPVNPQISQGTLNRVRASVIVAGYTSLNIASSYMGKNFVSVRFDGDFSQLINTATGAVTSPEPYVFADIEVDLLRTQSLSQDWITQAKATSVLGDVTVHPDTTTFDAMQFNDVVIRHIDPGAFDGQDPVVRLSLRGVFFVNNNLWTFV